MSDSSRPHGLQPTRLLRPWDFPGKNTGVGCHCLLPGEQYGSPLKKLIKNELNNENIDIHFIVGGTLVNKTVISHILRPYEAVICADTGHINVHETGAIESTGHKVITIKNHNGKIATKDIENCVKTRVGHD